ncbi:Hypothetical protein GLP15_4676 [Giardia lamblia P15]|uniref:Uncharacterized protein n=1 Tax=Giardia intestinalis (strain P15) TaxID=658858 RepID=E1F1S8_GIAIA|nr:Hypothetical protein GLP15_4676 [Giardia lamblia P15]
MSAQLALELHSAGVTVYIQTSTSRLLLVEEFADTLYSFYDSEKEFYSLTAPTATTPCCMFTGIVRRMLGMQISETSLLVSQCLGIAFTSVQLTSKYFDLVINETLSRTALQTKDITSCCILVPDSFIVLLTQTFMQLFPAILSLAPVYIPQSHVRALQWTLRGAEDNGIPTGLHFQIAMHVSSSHVSLVGLGTRFLSKIAANGGTQYNTVSQLATCIHSCGRFAANVVDRMRVLCYQKLAEIRSRGLLLEDEEHILRTKGVEFLQSLHQFLLDGLSCALYKEFVDFRIVLPAIQTQSGHMISLFIPADFVEVLTLSAHESYNCIEIDGTLRDEPVSTVGSEIKELQLEDLSLSMDYSGESQPIGMYTIVITGDFFYRISRELNYACNDILDSIVNPLVDILSAHAKTGVKHLPPSVALYQSPYDADILFDLINDLLKQRYQGSEHPISLYIEQLPLKDCIPLFFNNISVFRSYIIPHYVLDISVSYPLGQQVLHLIHDDSPSDLGIIPCSGRDQFLHNIDLIERHLTDNFQSNLSILKPVFKSVDMIIEQEVDLRIAVTNTAYSPFLQEDTLHGLVLRRPLVFSQSAICLQALHIILEPTLGLGLLGVSRIRDYLDTCEAVVKLCDISQDINSGVPQEKVIEWDTMKDLMLSFYQNKLSGCNLLSCSKLLRIDLGTPTHMSHKLPEPTCRVLLDVVRRYTGSSVPWYIDLLINRTHAVLSLHYFSEKIHLLLTGEMHNRFITRNESIDGLFKTGRVYYGLYRNKLHSIFLFDIECLFGREETTLDHQGPIGRSRSTLLLGINPVYITLMEASLNLHIGYTSEHIIQVVDILYDNEKEIRAKYAAVITELLFPLNLSPLPLFEGSFKDIWTYFKNIKIIGDLRYFIERIGEHGFLDHKHIYYNSKGVLCTMVRPRCLRDQDFLSLPSLFAAFKTAANYITYLSGSAEVDSLSDWCFLYNVASSLLPTTFKKNEFSDTLFLYRKMYDLKSSTPITKISLIDCVMYHTIRLLQTLSQTPSARDFPCLWHVKCLDSDIMHSNDRLLAFTFIAKDIISDKAMRHHPAVTALKNLPVSINSLEDISIIIRASFVYRLSKEA